MAGISVAALKTAQEGFTSLVKFIRETKAGMSVSLPERAKAATVISRVYIDNELGEEEILLPLCNTMSQMYIAYVMTVLGLEQHVTGSKNVSDITRVVSSESLADPVRTIMDNFGTDEVSMEGDVKHSTGTENVTLSDKEAQLVSGKLIEMGIGTDSGGIVPVRILVQLIPQLIRSEIAGGFLGLNLKPSKEMRRAMRKSGQISFFKDFLFCRDRLKELKDRLRNDETGQLAAMVSQKTNKLTRYWLNLAANTPNYNAAGGVLLISRSTFQKELSNLGIKFDSRAVNDFFKQSMLMQLVVVDNRYNEVDIYTHGIRDHGTYTFDMINKVGSSKQGVDIKDLMTMMANGSPGRL